MRSIAAAIIVGLVGIGTAEAAASTSTGLAETGAFLLGHAYRCGVPAARVSHAAQVIHDLIAAAAPDQGEQKAAASRFAEGFLAAAHPDRNTDALIPPCKPVVQQFE